jgi:hypothetical protein
MSGIIAAGWPSNMLATVGAYVESDVFDICHRILEIDPDLLIVPNDPGHAHRFSIQHLDKNGNAYLVMTAETLDARILTDLQYLLHVPFEKRYAEAERLEAERERQRDEEQREKLYEKMGYQFYRQLDRCGFIQRSDILPKRNRIAQRYRSQTATS